MRKGGDGVELKPGRHLATLASTLRQSVVLCEPQERNTSNRIFGGMFISRMFFSYELCDMLCGRNAASAPTTWKCCCWRRLIIYSCFDPRLFFWPIGFLMQKAYELAYATTIRVTGSKAPVFLGVDDISFIRMSATLATRPEIPPRAEESCLAMT
jgi:hypothetical protein